MSHKSFPPTTLADWTRSDHYHNSFLIPKDPIFDTVLKNNIDHELPDIAVSPTQGKFLMLLAKSIGAKRILEIGTLGAYSTIWLARALPDDGELITIEMSPEYAQLALQNLTTASVSSKVKVINGLALPTLQSLPDHPKFDLVFIDADKPPNAAYFKEAKRLVRSGGVIIVDNVVRNGLVSIPSHTDPHVLGVRGLLDIVQGDEEVDATTMGTAGEKGWDGFLYAVRK